MPALREATRTITAEKAKRAPRRRAEGIKGEKTTVGHTLHTERQRGGNAYAVDKTKSEHEQGVQRGQEFQLVQALQAAW